MISINVLKDRQFKPVFVSAIVVLVLALSACAAKKPSPYALALTPMGIVGPGGTSLTHIDGVSVDDATRENVTPGPHKVGVSCHLFNGLSLQFSMEVDFAESQSYCFFGLDVGKSCTIGYTQRKIVDDKVRSCVVPQKHVLVKADKK